mgnify:CR=1 FL=1
MFPRPPTDVALLVAAAIGVVVLERWGGSAHPLDPVARTGFALLVTVGLLGICWGVGQRFGPRGGLRVAVVTWAVFTTTEAAHLVGGSPWAFGLLAVPICACTIWWPRGTVLSIPLCALGVSLLRPVADRPPDAVTDPKLLVITVDTIRADTDLWEAAGIAANPDWWTHRAIAPAPWTPPSMVSLWVGTDVVEHGGGIELGDRVTMPRGGLDSGWPAHWSRAGFTTEAVVSNAHLRAEVGFEDGFTAFWHSDEAREGHLVLHTWDASWKRWSGTDTHRGRTRDEQLTDLGVARLAAGAEVVWVHLLEPHEYARRAVDAHPEAKRAAYARAVVDTGQRIAQLVSAAGDATIVVVGDHGESLGENQRWGHGRYPVAEVLEVPLAIRHAGTVQEPPSAMPALPSLGRWLAHLATESQAPYRAETVPRIAGVRGAPEQQYEWSPGLRIAVPTSEPVVAGPLGHRPNEAIRDALEALGYFAGSAE